MRQIFMTATAQATTRSVPVSPTRNRAGAVASSFPVHPDKPSVAYILLSANSEGTYQTLEAMAECVRGECPPDFSGCHDEWIRQKAENIVRNVKGQDADGEIKALFDFVKDKITYRKHPINQQRLQDCRRTLEFRSGDCVSKSVCLATLLAALGYEPRFVAQCPDGDEYTHVYVEVLTNSGWFPLDPVAEQHPMGWTQPLAEGGHETVQSIF